MSSDRSGGDARSQPTATRFADRFAETSVKGALTRAALAWIVITPVVAAAKVWWSGPAAAVVGVIAVTVYAVVALRFRRRHREAPMA